MDFRVKVGREEHQYLAKNTAQAEFAVLEKKLYWYTTFGPIEVMEPLWRNGTGIERPFSATAGVNCRGSSLPLQRVMTDFGADHPFAPAAAKLKEHYGIDVPVSAVQRTTEHHAQCMYEQEAAREIAPGTSAELFIGEIDGSMVPVVESSAASADQRKGKVLSWKEVRLTLVHRHGSVSPVFGGHLAGGVEESGRQWELSLIHI